MIRISVLCLLLLAACETPPKEPPAHVLKLQGMCDAGDREACGMLLSAGAEARAANLALASMMIRQNTPVVPTTTTIITPAPNVYIPPAPVVFPMTQPLRMQ